jgi:hypothetical protein
MSTIIAKAREEFFQLSNESKDFEQKLENWTKTEMEKKEKLFRDHNLLISNEEGKKLFSADTQTKFKV